MSIAPYGSAPNPLAAIDEPCPDCGSDLVAYLDLPDDEQLRMATLILEPHDREHWSRICTVNCRCGWIGSAYRHADPIEEAKAA